MKLLIATLIILVDVPQEHLTTNAPEGFIGQSDEEIIWAANAEVPGMESAILFGNPSLAGPFAVRVKLPPNIRIAPHTHIEDRTYTILTGEWRIGFDEKMIGRRNSTIDYGPGSIYRLPALIPHYQESGPDGAIIQIEAVGPSATDFLRPGSKWSPIN